MSLDHISRTLEGLRKKHARQVQQAYDTAKLISVLELHREELDFADAPSGAVTLSKKVGAK